MPFPSTGAPAVQFPCHHRRYPLVAGLLLLAGLLIVLPARIMAADGTTQEQLRAEREHYDKQIHAYREMRDKVERGSVSEAQWQAGQDIKEFGMETLREIKWGKMMTDLTDEVQMKLAPQGGGPSDPAFNHHWFIITNSIARGTGQTGKLLEDYDKMKKAADALLQFNNLPAEQKTSKAQLEAAIAQGEILRKALVKAEGKFGYQRTNELGVLTDGIMAGLHLAAGFASGNDEDAREKHFVKFTQESSESLLKCAKVLIKKEAAANPSLGLHAALARVYGELGARFLVTGASQYLGTNLVREAELRKENTLSDLTYRIMVADYEKDKVLAAQRRLERGERLKEPGGIKFSRQRADDLALKIDIDSVAYDPIRGRLVFSGKKTEAVFDMDIFADVLRLAVEEHEPFFSMEPSRIEDWDLSVVRFCDLLRKKHPLPQALAERVRELCPHPIVRSDRNFYYTTAYDLDPGLFAEANHGYDISEKLVFSPNWLRYSKVGWILYEADMAIKAVAGGFLERWPDVIPSPAWDLPDFNPTWLNRRKHHSAGRANFELDEGSLNDVGGRLGLDLIRPKLFVTFRETGTHVDVKPQPPACKEISDHFTRNWRTYVERIPELKRLQEVYKAYVAARYLVQQHPGLAERVRKLPRQIDWPEQPPLRIIRPDVIRVCYEGDRLVSLDEEQPVFWDIGGGFGGGAVFKYRKITPVTTPAVPAEWSGSALLDPGSQLDSVDQGDQAAIAFDIGDEPMPPEPLQRTTVLLGALLLGAALFGAALRLWDWQQLEHRQACTYCRRVHSVSGRVSLFGHALAATGMFVLLGLPLLAAWYGAGGNWWQLALSILLLTGAAAAFTLLGLFGHAVRQRFRPEAPSHRGLMPAFYTGTHLGGIALLAVLWQHGWSTGAIAATCLQVLGPDVGERLFVQLASPAPLAWASWALASGLLIVLMARWVAPLVFGSRPLLFSASIPHHH